MEYKIRIRRKNRKQAFRKLLGFTQDNYAHYLGITKGLLSLIELGKRSLSGEPNLKNAQLLLRWQNFEKTWQSPDVSESDLASTKVYLIERLKHLKFQQESKSVKKENSEISIDFQKANAFLEMELAQSQNPDDVLPLDLTKRLNQRKISKTPHLDALKESLEDRFLEFQIGEVEKELAAIEK